MRRLRTRLALLRDAEAPRLALLLGSAGAWLLLIGLLEGLPVAAATGALQLAVALVCLRDILRSA